MTTSPSTRRGGRRLLLGTAALVVLVVASVVLYLFQPWKLWTDTTVDEALPGGAAAAADSASPTGSPNAASMPAPTGAANGNAAAAPKTLASGTFITYEHRTTGTARVVELADGRRVLRLENLDTSEGPDVRIWLSAKPHTAGLHGFEGPYVELGKLKGNHGNQNYEIPPGTQLRDYRSVVIWCKRFSVAFGAAPLAA
jgi:Electron transfer DM13